MQQQLHCLLIIIQKTLCNSFKYHTEVTWKYYYQLMCTCSTIGMQ